MAADSTFVELHLDAGEDSDALEIDELTTKLRGELIQLDVDSVERPAVGAAPPGSKAVDVAALGTLVVGLANSAEAIKGVINSIRDWLTRQKQPQRSVKVQMGGDTLELTGVSSEEQERLVAAWIDRHSE